MRFPLRTALATALLGLAPLVAAAAGAIDWSRHADVETVFVLTTNEDGTPRETKIWLIVVDGEGYIRTGGSTWGKNVARQPEIALRIGEEELPVRAEFVEDDALRERIHRAFREKYGFSDALISPIRGRRPKMMHLVPR